MKEEHGLSEAACLLPQPLAPQLAGWTAELGGWGDGLGALGVVRDDRIEGCGVKLFVDVGERRWNGCWVESVD